MNFNAQTKTKPGTDRPHQPLGSIPTPPKAVAPPGIVIRHLDLRDSGATGDVSAHGRTLWVSLMNPRSLLGPLLDETAFEGAWLERDGRARIRLQGQGDRPVATPLFHSPESARSWLASELLRQVADPHDQGIHNATGTIPESLAA
jgi:hypothetical protein